MNNRKSTARKPMGDILTHPRFDRPKVVQPRSRLRRGTISFRRRRAAIMMARRSPEVAEQIRRSSLRALGYHTPDAREAELLPLYVPNSGPGAFAVMRALAQLGIRLDFLARQNAIVLRWDEPRPVA